MLVAARRGVRHANDLTRVVDTDRETLRGASGVASAGYRTRQSPQHLETAAVVKKRTRVGCIASVVQTVGRCLRIGNIADDLSQIIERLEIDRNGPSGKRGIEDSHRIGWCRDPWGSSGVAGQ